MNQQNFSAMRATMIASQLRTVGVNDPALLAAFGAVARDTFVPEARAALAYVDMSLPITASRALNTPMASALLLSEAKIVAGEHVLLIGAATGYIAAVIAQLGAQVVAVEEDAELLALATRSLAGLTAITAVDSALIAGAPAHAPYDVIVIDGAVEQVPDALLAQLKDGGRLVTGLIDSGVTRLAAGYKSTGGFGLLPFTDAACIVFPTFSKPKAFSFS